MNDPYLPQILTLLATGAICTGFSISGYLHGSETANLGGVQLQYPAPVRKIPLAMLGAGLCISAWTLSQDRQEWRQQYHQWQRHAQQTRSHQQAIMSQANLAAYQQWAQLQAAEKLYPQMAPYLDATAEPLPEQSVPTPLPSQSAPLVTPPPESTQPTPKPSTPDPSGPSPVEPAQSEAIAYLQNFQEYPALIFGGMGAGKSWTTRYIALQKVRAGHQVVVLDPHAATHEWQGVRHIGAGMDYDGISDFLSWYLAEITRRYQEFNQSSLSEEDWQESLRQQGRVVSVLCEEMTNYADRLSGSIASDFFKAAMTDSRKVLMPPLFVAHDRTLACLGDAKGLARTRNSSLLELELIPTIHPTTRKPVSSGKGKLKLPGHPEWLDVELPKVERKITDFRTEPGERQAIVTPPAAPDSVSPAPDFRTQVVNWLEGCWQAEASTTPSESTIQALPQPLPVIVQRCREAGGELSVREACRAKGLANKFSAEQMKAWFYQLQAAGVGTVMTDDRYPDRAIFRLSSQHLS